MAMLTSHLGSVVPALGWTLAHFLWQGALVALVLQLFLRTCRTARARHDLALGALVLMAILPVVTFAWLQGDVQIVFVPPDFPGLDAQKSHNWEAAAVGFWLAGVAVLAIRAAGGFLLIERVRRAAQPLPPAWADRCQALHSRLAGSLKVIFAQSDAIATPIVAGWLKPMVLIPTAALTRLPVDHIEALILHELAHVRRLDAFANLIQTVVETLLFYHPAVWWVSRRVRLEREHCCDDLAVATVRDPALYVRALQAIDALRTAPSGVLAANGGDLKGRAARILGLAAGPAQPALSRTAAVLILTAAAAAMTHGAAVEARPSASQPDAAGTLTAITPEAATSAASTAPRPSNSHSLAAEPRIVLAEATTFPSVGPANVALAAPQLASLIPAPSQAPAPTPVAATNTISPVVVTSPGAAAGPDFKVKMFGSSEMDPDFVLWPTAGYQKRRDGRATLRCLIDPHGLAEHCDLVSEGPPGLDFGKTALALRPTFKLPPAMGADGPVSATRTIAVVFRSPVPAVPAGPATVGEIPADYGPSAASSAAAADFTLSNRRINIIESPLWVRTPTFDDLARAYPAKGGGEEGYAVASCYVKPTGDLEGCFVIKETPADHGFERAALSLTASFKVSAQSMVVRPRHGLMVNIPIRMPPPGALADRTVMAPQWVLGVDSRTTPKVFPPEAAAMGLTTGRGVARCAVAIGGTLTDCAPDPGEPDSLGFAAAAARLASGMKMNLWSADGVPVEGGVVHIPVRLNLKGG